MTQLQNFQYSQLCKIAMGIYTMVVNLCSSLFISVIRSASEIVGNNIYDSMSYVLNQLLATILLNLTIYRKRLKLPQKKSLAVFSDFR